MVMDAPQIFSPQISYTGKYSPGGAWVKCVVNCKGKIFTEATSQITGVDTRNSLCEVLVEPDL
eukprot:scaffold73959_cov21-Cyclotella_meneghiniana.AAC.3